MAYRLIVGPGLGRYLLKDERNTLAAELGIAYIRDRVGSHTEDRTAWRVSDRYVLKLSDTAKLWE